MWQKNCGAYTFIVMRAHRDKGAQYISKEMDQLRAVPDRQPWQVSSRVDFPTIQSGNNLGNVTLQPVHDVTDNNGLAAYTLILKPHARTYAPDPAQGDGQYLVVIKGSLLHDNKKHKSYTLVFVRPDEGPYQVQAGAEGLEAIVLNFPQLKRCTALFCTWRKCHCPEFKKWQCSLCAFAYDEARGMPEEHIPAGSSGNADNCLLLAATY